ncbi:MAG TPA: TraM recognition domain-containing protein, partial [Sphingobacteriaceae bacterium]
VMFKYIWQRAMEKRRVHQNGRPVFLWADEAQHFLHEHDATYQATARSSRIATVYISQNLPNYFANMGGQNSQYKVKSFLGTLGTKIFHANADIETNEYASKLIGQAYTNKETLGKTVAGKFSSSQSTTYELASVMRPEQFVSLKTGGPANNNIVDGILHMQGNQLARDFNFKKIRFDQNFTI